MFQSIYASSFTSGSLSLVSRSSEEMFVEKLERIDVFHDGRKGVNETAVIYEIQSFLQTLSYCFYKR